MKKTFLALATAAVLAIGCSAIAACTDNNEPNNNEPNNPVSVTLSNVYSGQLTQVTSDNGYGSEMTIVTGYELLTFSNNTYMLTSHNSIEAFAGGYTAYVQVFYGTYTASGSTFTLAQPARAVQSIHAHESMSAYAPDSVIDTADASTLGEDYDTVAEAYAAIVGEQYISSVTVDADVPFISSVSKSATSSTIPTAETVDLKEYVSYRTTVTSDNGYGGEMTTNSGSTFVPLDGSSYAYITTTSIEAWEGAYSTLVNVCYGTYTVSGNSYTLAKPTRAVQTVVPATGMEAYMPKGVVDTDDATTYGDYESKDEALTALTTAIPATVSVVAAAWYIA